MPRCFCYKGSLLFPFLATSKFPYGAQILLPGNRWGLVDLILTEKQVPYERIPVDMANGQHKTPEFIAMHPFGKIPVLDDDGFILCETRAICRYLADKYADKGTPLLPTDLKNKALFEQAASFEYTNFHPPGAQGLYTIVETLSIHSYSDVSPDHIKDALSAVSEKLAVYDVILGKQKLIGGNITCLPLCQTAAHVWPSLQELTLVDLFHLYYAP
ncbi:thioredoxin-like protein [Mycena rebaudengoi]|nr:thioredoxin-like protein [Mycena rebaudengoi]